MIDVSIVIVCMNNLKNLYPCLESIRKYTVNVKYETLVVAYLFTKENLERVKADFPWVTFIESNEIRGFSENNNLALKKAKGKYCFVLNDDTEMRMSVIEHLFDTIEKLPENVAIISPQIVLERTKKILLGKPQYNFGTFLLDNLFLSFLYKKKSMYINKSGIFQTYNISGAAFLIKKNIFEKIGWFDEKYFFCPEDIALSTKVNRSGFKCFVDSLAIIYHFSGGTWSKTIGATKPASVKGEFYFYGTNIFYRIIYILFLTFIFSGKIVYWIINGAITGQPKAITMMVANKNALYSLYSTKTPKELFQKFYLKK